MKSKTSLLICTIVILLSSFGFSQSTVYRVTFNEEISLSLVPYLKRALELATKEKADALIVEINTFGGRVDAATQLKDLLIDAKIPTIAFVNKRAISAGALITLSCKKIAMAPGSTIGAATVVDQEGKKGSEKYQSYMRAEMRSTAQKNGRNPKIAEGMVDERVVIPGLVDSTQLVSLDDAEAVNLKMADTIVNSAKAAAEAFGYSNPLIIDVKTNWAEEFVRFLNNPIIASLLIMLGLAGVYTEIKTPGFGVPGILGIVFLTLFFGSSLILDLASWFEVVLFILGLAAILVEIFLIPGFGVAGVVGILLMIASLFFSLVNTEGYFDSSLIQMAIIQLGSAIFGFFFLGFLAYKFLPNTRTFKNFVLDTESGSKSGFTSAPDHSGLVGKEGTALTVLRPAGTALIEGTRYDVVTQGDYIEKDSPLKVILVEGVRIVVQRRM
ncbi:MAG: nodulation protein NfeD [Ignavibacteria bacterium]|nr:nodulation protein NfeD [Ignavibacteria bacterium]